MHIHKHILIRTVLHLPWPAARSQFVEIGGTDFVFWNGVWLPCAGLYPQPAVLDRPSLHSPGPPQPHPACSPGPPQPHPVGYPTESGKSSPWLYSSVLDLGGECSQNLPHTAQGGRQSVRENEGEDGCENGGENVCWSCFKT